MAEAWLAPSFHNVFSIENTLIRFMGMNFSARKRLVATINKKIGLNWNLGAIKYKNKMYY